MACGCTKKKGTSVTHRVATPMKPSRPLSEGGRTRRTEKRIIL